MPDRFQSRVIPAAKGSDTIERIPVRACPDIRRTAVLAQVANVRPELHRNRDDPAAATALRRPELRNAVNHLHGFRHPDKGSVPVDILCLKRQQLLHTQPAAEQRADAVAEQIVWELRQQMRDLRFHESVLFAAVAQLRRILSNTLCLARGITENQPVIVCCVKNLDEHGTALADHRKRVTGSRQLVHEAIDVDLNLASKLEYDMQPLMKKQENAVAIVRQVVVDFTL